MPDLTLATPAADFVEKGLPITLVFLAGGVLFLVVWILRKLGGGRASTTHEVGSLARRYLAIGFGMLAFVVIVALILVGLEKR